MKKILSIWLLLLYTTTSFGFSVKQFYCCGKLSPVSLSLKQNISEESSKDGCCKNQFNDLKVIKDTHLLSVQSGSSAKYFTNLFLLNHLIVFYQGQVPFVSECLSVAWPAHASLLRGGIPAYIFNCTYRI
jgi:hypothetical protein